MKFLQDIAKFFMISIRSLLLVKNCRYEDIRRLVDYT